MSARPGAAGPSTSQPAPLVIRLSTNALEARKQLQQAAKVLRSGPRQQVVVDCLGRPLGAHGGLTQLIASLQPNWGQLVVKMTSLDITKTPRLYGRLRLEHVRLRAAPCTLLIYVHPEAQLEMHYCITELIPLPASQAAATRRSMKLCFEYRETGLIYVKPGGSFKAFRAVWRGLANCLQVGAGGSAVLEECWVDSTGIWYSHLWCIQASGGVNPCPCPILATLACMPSALPASLCSSARLALL